MGIRNSGTVNRKADSEAGTLLDHPNPACCRTVTTYQVTLQILPYKLSLDQNYLLVALYAARGFQFPHFMRSTKPFGIRNRHLNGLFHPRFDREHGIGCILASVNELYGSYTLPKPMATLSPLASSV